MGQVLVICLPDFHSVAQCLHQRLSALQSTNSADPLSYYTTAVILNCLAVREYSYTENCGQNVAAAILFQKLELSEESLAFHCIDFSNKITNKMERRKYIAGFRNLLIFQRKSSSFYFSQISDRVTCLIQFQIIYPRSFTSIRYILLNETQ